MKYTSRHYANEILKDIHNKKLILCVRDKNIEFMKQYGLSKEVIDNYVYQLTPNYFSERIENEDKNIKAKYLYVFRPLISLVDEYGFYNKIKLYIKLCSYDGDRTLIVSFHEDDK